ncbi:MAG: glucose-6-phosphate dehydrogenase, partial [Planctomycetota bacterium]
MVEELENRFSRGLPKRRDVAPCVIVLYGATGDLTHRKLIPALFRLERQGHLPKQYAIVGVARREKSDDEFRAGLRKALLEGASDIEEADGLVERFLSTVYYHRGPFEDAEGYIELRKKLENLDKVHGTAGNRLFYLATAPEYFAPIVSHLGEHGLCPRARKDPSRFYRVVVEKPFGHDLPSASSLNHDLLDSLDESQIYRIDHYLGKETVQNILAFRFSNGIFEPLWNQKYIDHVQITVSESLGVGSRGPYYDAAGAVRDMVQNHMMQLLSLVAMEPPSSLDADAVRDEKVKVLRAIRPLSKDDVRKHTVRAQYSGGSILGETVPGYVEEERVPEGTTTATYAA